MHVLRDGAQLDAGIAHDAAEADGRSVRGDDALDGEGDSEDVGAATFDLLREIVDDAADLLIVSIGVAVGERGMVPCFDDAAVQINGA